jgi:serine/threonine-protein kinase RsbW
VTLVLHATPQEVMSAVEALQALGQALRIPEKQIFGLTLALEECASNIVNHAYQRDARQTFRVAFESTANRVSIELRDHGPAFDPTKAQVIEEKGDDDRLPGGWGIQLVRRYVDEVRYARERNENVLRLVKHFEPATGQK